MLMLDVSGTASPAGNTVTNPPRDVASTVTFISTADASAGIEPRPASATVNVSPSPTGRAGAPLPVRVSRSRSGLIVLNPANTVPGVAAAVSRPSVDSDAVPWPAVAP